MSRYTQDIKDIVGVDKIKADIAALKNKPTIPPIRSVSYQSSNGQTQNATGNTGTGGIMAPSDTLGTQNQMSDDANNALTGSSQSTTGDSAGLPSDADNGVFDLADIIDNNADQDTLFTGVDGFGNNLSGISGWHDCSSGVDGTLNLTGNFVPPVGWDDPNTGAAYEGFEAGYFWSATNPASANGATPAQAAENAITAIKGIFPASYPSGYGDASVSVSPSRVSSTEYTFGWIQGPGASVNTVSVFRNGCTTEEESICPASAPTQTVWPKTGTFQLTTNANGLFTSNVKDTEAPAKYAGGVSTVQMCFGSGRKAALSTGVGGTKVLYELDTGTGLIKADAVVRVYNPQGQLVAYGDSTTLTKYLKN